jgi:hypothetical protein
VGQEVQASDPQSARCSFCGAVSRLRHLYRELPAWTRSGGPVCPGCQARPSPGWDYLWPFIGLLALAGLVAGLFAQATGAALYWIAALLVMPVGLILLHECCHALAARLVGATVFEIRIGWHRPLWQIPLGRRARLTIARGVLRGGYCVAAFLGDRRGRWRYAVLYGTPMLLHAVAVAVTLPMLEAPWRTGLDAVHLFLLFNVALLMASARPFDNPAGTYTIPSDGLALWRLARDPSAADRWRRRAVVLPALYALAEGRPEDARAEAYLVEVSYPDDPEVGGALFTAYWSLGSHVDALRFLEAFTGARAAPDSPEEELQQLSLGGLAGERYERWIRCAVYLHGEAWEAAERETHEALETEDSPQGRALWQAMLAYTLLLGSEDPVRHEKAGTAAREAFETLPWVAFVCDAHAAALLERGALAESLKMLAEADRLDLDDLGLCARNAWRAIARARLGQCRRARRALRAAHSRGLEIGPPPALLERAEKTVDACR